MMLIIIIIHLYFAVLHYDTAPFTAAALIGESAILHNGHRGAV